jgi:hypothetical protein
VAKKPLASREPEGSLRHNADLASQWNLTWESGLFSSAFPDQILVCIFRVSHFW